MCFDEDISTDKKVLIWRRVYFDQKFQLIRRFDLEESLLLRKGQVIVWYFYALQGTAWQRMIHANRE